MAGIPEAELGAAVRFHAGRGMSVRMLATIYGLPQKRVRALLEEAPPGRPCAASASRGRRARPSRPTPRPGRCQWIEGSREQWQREAAGGPRALSDIIEGMKCGGETLPGQSWCRAHATRVFLPRKQLNTRGIPA